MGVPSATVPVVAAGVSSTNNDTGIWCPRSCTLPSYAPEYDIRNIKISTAEFYF